MQHVHERDVSSGNDHELVHFGYDRDVQRYEFAVRERVSVQAAIVEEHVPCWRDHDQHGTSFHDPLRALLHREFANLAMFLADRHVFRRCSRSLL